MRAKVCPATTVVAFRKVTRAKSLFGRMYRSNDLPRAKKLTVLNLNGGACCLGGLNEQKLVLPANYQFLNSTQISISTREGYATQGIL
jgi:hypothetical protein